MCAIYLKHGDDLVEMVEQPYEAEAVLQKLLADYPNLLSGDQDSEVRKRWLLVGREIGIASAEETGDRWSADHLFLDEEGVPTMDDWGWEQLRPWLEHRPEMPIGALFCVVNGRTRGRPWSASAVRSQLRQLALRAGVRSGSPRTSFATLTPSRWPARACRST